MKLYKITRFIIFVRVGWGFGSKFWTFAEDGVWVGGYQNQTVAKMEGGVVHSTWWEFSTWWKFRLYFVYVFIADWDFLTKFCSSDPNFNGNVLTFLYLKFDTSEHAQLCDYLFIHTIHKFHGMALTGNSHWGYLLINGVYR